MTARDVSIMQIKIKCEMKVRMTRKASMMQITLEAVQQRRDRAWMER